MNVNRALPVIGQSAMPYVVMRNYHTEGWKIECSCADFNEAVLAREETLAGMGGGEVVIFKRVALCVSEFPQ